MRGRTIALIPIGCIIEVDMATMICMSSVPIYRLAYRPDRQGD